MAFRTTEIFVFAGWIMVLIHGLSLEVEKLSLIIPYSRCSGIHMYESTENHLFL